VVLMHRDDRQRHTMDAGQLRSTLLEAIERQLAIKDDEFERPAAIQPARKRMLAKLA
jgi:hypothetical protein